MTAAIRPLAAPTVESAWEDYRRHRALEADRPRLADDAGHVAESRRLHSIFMALYDQRPASTNVIPFARVKG